MAKVKRPKIRVFNWECERCSTWNESRINVCWFCGYLRVKPCMAKMYGGLISKMTAITCLKCGRDASGNYDLRKIGGRPRPLATLYPGTLDRLEKDLAGLFPDIKEVLDGLRPYVHQELCYSCHPDEGGALAQIQPKETLEERVRIEAAAKEVKEALDRKAASSDPETFDAESVARGLIKRIDEDMAYDAMDRRVRFMIREARPVKFSLMKKNLNGDDLLSAMEDIRHRISQLTWRYNGSRNAAERFLRDSDKESRESERLRRHVENLEKVLEAEKDLEKRLQIEISITMCKKRYLGAEKRSDKYEEARAKSIGAARKDIKYIRAYRSLLHELSNVYGIRWSTLISDKVSKGSSKFYPIREEAFGVEEFDTPMIEQEKCNDCGKARKSMYTYGVTSEFVDEKGKAKTKVVDTLFLCKKCFNARKSGIQIVKEEEREAVKKESIYQDSEVMTRNMDKEKSEEIRKLTDRAVTFAKSELHGKVQQMVTVENVNYKTYECDLWIVAVPAPRVKIPKKISFEGKVIQIASVPSGNFGSAYLWAKLGVSGREKWTMEAGRRCWSISKLGLLKGHELVRDPHQIAGWLEVKLPDFSKEYWRAEYELGNYSDMPWVGRMVAVGPSDVHYEEVLLHKAGLGWMEEIERDQKAFDDIEEAWYKYGVQLGNAPKEIKLEDHGVGKMFTCSIYPGPMIVKDQEELDRGRKNEELWQKLQRVKGEFDQLGNDVFSFAFYLKAWGRGRDFDVVYAEWKKDWDIYQAKLKGNKGNAQPK